MKSKLSMLLILISLSLYSQEDYWKINTYKNKIQDINLKHLNKDHYKIFQLETDNFKLKLEGAPLRGQLNNEPKTVIRFPSINGEIKDYDIIETSIFSDPVYAAKNHPNIKTYLGFSRDNSGERVRFSITPLGLKAMISIPGKEITFIQPVSKKSNEHYLVYNRDAKQNSNEKFECLMDDLILKRRHSIAKKVDYRNRKDANDQLLRTFRIAISTTSEYTSFWDDGDDSNGNAQADAFAQMVSTLNRTNEVFEVDMAISFVLVDTADDPALNLVYSGTDPYSSNLNNDLQTNLTATVGEADYDIGHLLHKDKNNGNAGCIGCVCGNRKGSAFSSHSFTDNDGGPYMSDFFDIDYVPHEIGHQMGANHTWSFTSENTGVNVEPGSGTTIMGYAGITAENDVQDHSDPYFHYFSIDQILRNIENKCAVTTPITNAPPVADAGRDYNIPPGTAFVLTATATDPNPSDVLSYCWEQIDNGISTQGSFGPLQQSGATWRSRPPSLSPKRYMPIFDRVLDGKLTESNPIETLDNSSWETVSNVARDLNFAVTVRDRSEMNGLGQMPQSNFDLMKVTVENVPPFTINTPTVFLPGVSNEIIWNVGETNNATINCQKVTIKLSTDNGLTFPTILASNTDNDGSEMVNIPALNTDTARLLIEATDNIFYAVSPAFPITDEASFTITNVTNSQTFCNPNSVTYDFEFKAVNGFSETVAFSATGQPQGSTVAFSPISNNSDVVTMTIDNLNSATEGVYKIEVIASSTSITKSTTIELVLIDTLCGSAGSTEFNDGITGVVFNTINNLNNGKPSGYSDFTNLSTDVLIEERYDLTVNVNTDGDFGYIITAWIDWNQNCILESNEQYDLGEARNVVNDPTSNSPLSITVPTDAILGNTRMRVIMDNGILAFPCVNDFFGEVEDYSINVTKALSTNEFNLDSQLVVYPNPNKGEFNVKLNRSAPSKDKEIQLTVYDIRGRIVYNKQYEEVLNFNEKINLETIQSGLYLLKVSNNNKTTTKKIIIK